DAQPRIVVEHPPGAIHPGQHAGAERVLRFGAVECDGQYVAVAVEQTVVAIHAGSSVVRRMSKSSARRWLRGISSRSRGSTRSLGGHPPSRVEAYPIASCEGSTRPTGPHGPPRRAAGRIRSVTWRPRNGAD